MFEKTVVHDWNAVECQNIFVDKCFKVKSVFLEKYLSEIKRTWFVRPACPITILNFILIPSVFSGKMSVIITITT